MSKIEYQEMQTRERAEIQKAITPGVQKTIEEAFATLSMPHDPDHVRRACRALVHVAAKIAMENGCSPAGWHYIMDAAWVKEQSEESLGEAVLYADSSEARA